MVCLGNICRSPLAEGIMKHKINASDIYIDSAGTSSLHSGSKPDKRSIEVASKYGIDISDQKSRQFTVSDFDIFDYIFVMDKSNYNDVIDVSRNQNDINKVSLILEYSSHSFAKEVPDPYYGGNYGFETVFKLLNQSCEDIKIKLKQNDK